MDKKSIFLKKYANLPLALRDEIIVIIDDKPLTWNAAYLEVKNDTEKSKEILEKLSELEILNETE